ncbi:hypothetical protein CEXT_712231, partial [Caerostris extrusa]
MIWYTPTKYLCMWFDLPSIKWNENFQVANVITLGSFALDFKKHERPDGQLA